MRRVLALALTLATAPAAAQRAESPEPRRPVLDAGRDTNNARDYYQYGLQRLGTHSAQAADAFYWASRLDPMWPEPLYARRVALLMALDVRSLGRYLDREPRMLESREVRHADTLATRAFWRDPLLYRRLDADLLASWLRKESDFTVDLHDLDDMSSATRGWLAYTRGQFVESVRQYNAAIRHDSKAFWLHGDRARSFAMMLQYDSALVELQKMMELQQKRAEREQKVTLEYESKAMDEYSIGRVQELRGNLAEARAAYGRALVEELGFHPAHAALGRVAMAQGDTGTAVTEYQAAVELAADDPALQYEYGVALLAARKYEDAQKAFARSVELDPYFVAPYFPLAYIEYNSGDDVKALAHYSSFATLAPRAMQADVARAQAAIKEIKDNGPPVKK